MDQSRIDVEKQLKKLHGRRSWRKIISILSSIVVFCTTYALILPAITMSDTTYCGIEEHKHQESCYTEEIVCEMVEHMHSLSCFSNPYADLETQEEWEQTIPKELTGDWRQDVLQVAKSQLGYQESDNNYVVADGEEQKGYTRYGEWYGDPYGHWCAMFVSFCLNYADVEGVPLESNCQQWINKLSKAEYDLYRDAADYIPTAGDIIFFDWDLDGVSHHVGLVAEAVMNEEGCLDKVKVLEGNSINDRVEYITYEGNNPQIMGYGELLQPSAETKLVFEDEAMKVTAVFAKEYELPENAQLFLHRIDKETNQAQYESMAQSVETSVLSDDNQILSHLDLYEVYIQVDGEVVEVPVDLEVKLTVEYKDTLYTEEIELVSELAVVTVAEPIVQTFAAPGRGEMQYVVSEPEATVNEVERGVTGFSMNNEGLQTFGVATVTTTRTGNVWKRLETFSDLKNGDTILLVSVEGNVTLTYGDDTLAIPVILDQVKGNPSYYDITGRITNDSLAQTDKFKDSKFTVSNAGTNKFSLRSQGTTKRYLSLASGTVFSNSETSLAVSQELPENSWKVYNDKYYLTYDRDEKLLSSSNSKNARRDMYIFQLVNTSLKVPEDCKNVLNPPQIPDEPQYDSAIVPTDELEGKITISGIEKLQVDYASDQSTSDIETQFKNTVEDDGKVLTDKSVIYGKDDYGAFSKYEAGEFGITLSALGQVTTERGEIKPLMDVVIILDTSYSMINNASHYLDEDGKVRMEWAMPAVNEVIHQIMQVEENRVGLVTFSDTSQVVLPLDHYTTKTITNGKHQYLDLVKDTSKDDDDYTPNHGRGTNFYDLNINSGVKNSKGATPTFNFLYGPGYPNWEGTFTQSGIAEAANILLNNDDTMDNNDNPRQPVIILISDGGPTLSSSNYKNPLDGPIYGNSGQTVEGDHDEDHSASNANGTGVNRYGINGFYTVLTAQYYKNLVGSHYNLQTKFASVGIGIDTSQNSSTDKRLHDNRYCRAVLNPSVANLADAVNTFDNFTDEGQQFISLLNNNFNKQYVSIPNHSDGFTTIGTTYSAMPVIKNPYKDTGYAYCDIYYTGKNTTLAHDLISYLKSVQRQEHTWRTIIQNQTDVEIVDQIGEGMEIKGAPVLRFGNTNYSPVDTRVEGNTTTYVYSKKDVNGNLIPVTYSEAYPKNAASDNKPANTQLDLTRIRVIVTNEGEGANKLQTIKMYVPEDLLPVIYPELYGDFFYREDPVRLTFKVGLTEESIELCKNMPVGESKVFYTNRWDENGSVSAEGNFTRYHGADNPNDYPFENMPDIQKEGATNANPTETNDFSFQCEVNGNEITQKLGNNGRLVIAQETTTVSVVKRWSDKEEHEPVTIHLLADGKKVEGRTISLPKDNKWEYTWKSLPKLNEKGEEIQYTVLEDYVPGYTAASKYVTAGEKISYGQWKESTSFTENKDYLLVSAETGDAHFGQVLAASETDKFKWAEFKDFNSRPDDKSLIWTRQSGSKLYNNETKGKMGYAGSGSGRYFTSNGNAAISYEEGTLSFKPTMSSRRYFTGLNSNNYGAATTNSSDDLYALKLYAWEGTEETITEDAWVIINNKTEEPLKLTLKKTDNYQIPLSGAKFILYKESDEGEVIQGTNGTVIGTILNSNITVDDSGETEISLPKEDGTYYLVETVAPDDYTLLMTPIKIVVFGENITVEDHEMAELLGSTLTVINKKGYEFPKTGGIGTNKYIWSGAALMVFAILICIKNVIEGRKEYETY